MSFIKIYIHLVWSTKYRLPHLSNPQIRRKMWFHIKDNAMENGIHVDYVSGYVDHCHCLISLNSLQSVSYVTQMLKGESAHWMNQNNFISELFEWQDGYYAASVSESEIKTVRNYIKNQEAHHKNTSFDEEMNVQFGLNK